MSDPISVTVKQAADLVGCSTRVLYELANKGDIESRCLGRKRLILFSSLKAYVEGLPIDPPDAA